MDVNNFKELPRTNRRTTFENITGTDPNQFEESVTNKQIPLGFVGAMGLVQSFLSPLVSAEQAAEDVTFIDRAVQSKNYFDKDIDPRLKKLYLNQGAQGLKYNAGNILKELIPPSSTSPFIPADLSMAGKYKEILENITPINYPVDNITVTPGPNPGRFATSELTSIDTDEAQGSKGYIWGNPETPQWTYASGNWNKNPNTTPNPALYMTRLDLPPENKGRFKRTDEVIQDPTLIEKRQWGQRGGTSEGDLYFPKENIKARGEVTAADLYTKIKNYGFDPGPMSINEKDPGGYFQNLADKLATLEGTPERPMPMKEMLENIATPVPTFGSSERERGAVPLFKEFDILNTPLEQRNKIGINKIFLDELDEDFARSHAYNPVSIDRQAVQLAIPRGLSTTPSTAVGRSFGNVNQLKSGGFLAGALYSPEVFKELEKKQYGSALIKAGSAAATGSLMDAAVRTGVVNAAKAGITLPARALAYANPAVAAVSMATLAPGSSRITPRQEAYENQLRETKFKQAEAARKRGGKFKFPTPFGQVTIPEFGMSETGGLFFR